jgi:hypothetical protein
MSFTADIGTEPPKGSFRLWAAKPPLVGESCASWVQRLCGDHQYSFKVLGQVLGCLPRRGDWDSALDIEVWQRLLGLVTFPDQMSIHGEMALLGAMSQTAKPACRLRLVDKRPAYRWCPRCFAEDQMPYLRWYWRLDSIRECWVHQTPLCDQCDVCGQPLLMHRARLIGQSALLLSECADCGASLSSQMESIGSYDRVLQRKLKSMFAPWWAGAGNRRIDMRLVPKYHFLIGERLRLATARSETNVRRRNEFLKQEKFWALDASCFRQDAALKIEKDVAFRAPWQWRVNPMKRLAVAEALRTIRAERRANQGDGKVEP